MKRVLTALLLIPVVSYVIFLAPFWLFAAVVATIALICFYEYQAIAAAHGFDRLGPLGYAAGLLVLVAPHKDFVLVTALALVGMMLAARSQELSKALPRAGAFSLGLLYVFGAWRCALLLRGIHPAWLFFALALNWVGDTAALYIGKNCGRRKLAPRVSPSKTWEGAAASLAASVAFGVLFLGRAQPQFPMWEAAALAAAASVAGQLGDLAESAVKRGAGVKDSGTLLPGHGGWLDRVDSSLFSMPLVYVWLARPW